MGNNQLNYENKKVIDKRHIDNINTKINRMKTNNKTEFNNFHNENEKKRFMTFHNTNLFTNENLKKSEKLKKYS
jgi:hypothetical protein